MPYADKLVNFVVVSRAECRVSGDEITRALVPRGSAVAPAGTVCVLRPVSRIGDGYVAFTKPVP